MKKIYTLLLFFSVILPASAQDFPCSDFNAPGIGNWQLINCYLNKIETSVINPLDLSPAISIRDNHTASSFENQIDYHHLGARFPGHCISFDYNVTNEGKSGITEPFHPVLYVSDILGRTIMFEAYTTVSEGKDWVHITAPIAHADPMWLTFPSNRYGSWNPNGYNTKDFNYIMDSAIKISFHIDVVGSGVTTEDVRLDNICVSKCQDSFSRSCNAQFELSLHIASDAAHPLHNNAFAQLLEYHKGSTYDYDWGDFGHSGTPVYHPYRPGSYRMSVLETTAEGAKCKSSIGVCVAEQAEPEMAAGPEDSCNANFLWIIRSATNRDLADNQYAEMHLDTEKPRSTYFYEWGNGHSSHSFSRQRYNEGNYSACMTEKMPDGSSCKKCVNVCVDNADPISTRIKDQQPSAKSNCRLIPNPAREQSMLEFVLSEKQNINVRVTDLMGKTVWQQEAQAYQAGTQSISINTSMLAPGIYTVAVASLLSTEYVRLAVVK
ncbi:MAG: T9SS type A sorting domain-containing protein [Chitinophagaceae bacterium]|jgi:hypothetical protein